VVFELLRDLRGLLFGCGPRPRWESNLGHAQDSEDAAQAVFVVLVRSAAALQSRSNLGPWLHRVATHVALDTRRLRAARETRERKATAMFETASPPSPQLGDEQTALLHEELENLPAKQREALIRFHLQGASLERTASEMGTPEGTVKAWLARGRKKLRERLARRGVTLSAGALAALLSAEGGAAELPASFVAATVKAAVWSASGQAAAAGAVSPQVVLLVEKVLKAMFYAKLKAAATILLAISLAGLAAGVVLWQALAGEPPAKSGKPALAAAREVVNVQFDNATGIVDLQLLREGNKIVSAFAVETQRNTPWLAKTDRLTVAADGRITGTITLTQTPDLVTLLGMRRGNKNAKAPPVMTDEVSLDVAPRGGEVEGTLSKAARASSRPPPSPSITPPRITTAASRPPAWR
jgi:RNA polymerase sigma factor (sigma-70 family)